MKRLIVCATALAVVGGAAVAVPASAAAPPSDAPKVQWGQCRTYSDEVIAEQAPGDVAAFTRVLARRECGTLSVPVDYRDPDGRQLTLAVTRLRATKPKRRIGALVMNPGGPGGAGVLLPAQITFSGLVSLAERYDLIGFDPRGVGDSSPRLDCGPVDFAARLTVDEAQARRNSALQEESNRACAATDPALAASLSNETIARDMDRIRAGLGERQLSYLGFSWGTGLGAVYQTLFPQNVRRMVLDSVENPLFRLDRHEDDFAAAREANFHRFARWMAQRQQNFGLGATRTAVEAQVRRIREFFTAHPQDVPGLNLVDEITVAIISISISLDWPAAASDLVKLKKVVDAGPPAFAPRSKGRRTVELPPQFDNDAVFRAVDCNSDSSSTRSFEEWFAQYTERRRRFPVAGIIGPPAPLCVGWPVAGSVPPYADTGREVMLVGHNFEDVTPMVWARAMAQRLGSPLVVVGDDVHAAMPDVPCANFAVAFLDVGRKPPARCFGFPLPEPDSGA